jgi:hypothetical protein
LRASTLFVLAAVLAAGCDTLSPGDEAATLPGLDSHKLRNWELAGEAGLVDPADATPLDSIGLIVSFNSSVQDPETASDSVFYGQEVRRRTYYRDSFTGVAVTVSVVDLVGVVDALTASPLVSFVEPDLPVLSSLPLVTILNHIVMKLMYTLSEWFMLQVRPWSVTQVGGQHSSTASGNGSGVVDMDVYVIDGRVEHPDINVVEHVDLVPAGIAPGDARHGTHVAGIIAAADDGNGIVGIAPGARIHNLEVLGAYGATTMSAILEAVELVVQRKRANPSQPMVVNLSLGRDMRTTRLNVLDQALAEAVEAGIVVVTSAGNDAVNAQTYSPAHAPGVITVGATDREDEFAAGFSNSGSSVDILAPGEDVVSVAEGSLLWSSMSGTSMAAAHVSGAAALFLSQNPTATPQVVFETMIRRTQTATGTPASTTTARMHVADY